jgi:hypothetical protein
MGQHSPTPNATRALRKYASIPCVSGGARKEDGVAHIGEAGEVSEAPAKAETSRNRRCDLPLSRRPLS